MAAGRGPPALDSRRRLLDAFPRGRRPEEIRSEAPSPASHRRVKSDLDINSSLSTQLLEPKLGENKVILKGIERGDVTNSFAKACKDGSVEKSNPYVVPLEQSNLTGREDQAGSSTGETSFEEALHMAQKRKTNWTAEATKVFMDICVKRIESMPPLNPSSWIGNPIITDIAIKLYYRTQIAYSNQQLFNKWKNFHKTRDKHYEVLMELKAITCKKASNTCESTSTVKSDLDINSSLSTQLLEPKLGENKEYETHAEVLCKENQQLRLQLAEEREQKKMLVDKIAYLEKQLFNADVIRRALHNQMMELKGSIRVFCRVRPMLTQNANKAKISYPQKGEHIGRCVTVERPEGKIHFTCDRVFNQKASQEEIFVEISELVQSALDGRKVNIFAYGQTGSGKTFTMLGEKEDAKGVIPRAIEKIFESIHLRESHGSVNIVKVSIIEIYNNENQSLNTPKSVVKTAKEALEAFEEALKKRSVAKTRLNDKSSRSHFIFKLFIYSTNKEMKMSEGVLNIIDLAGSERYDSEANEDLRREAKAINDSLLHLGIMLAAIEKGSHISSRNCKLTTELADSLGKDSKTLMFVNVASEEACVAETNSTFDFASAHIKSCNKTWEHISLKERTMLKEKPVGFKSPGIPSARPREDGASSVIKSPYSMLNKTAQRQGQGPSNRK